MALSAAAFTFACGGNPEPATPEPAEVQAPAAQAPAAQTTAPAPAAATLTDERAMELARGYVELLHDGEFTQVWEHVAPSARERFGGVENFVSEGSRILNELGPEVAIIDEKVEQPRAGMLANKLYLRTSHYQGSPDRPVRMMMGLLNDGSIVGIQVSQAE